MGEVYVLTNVSMPGLVKVGRSWNAAERARQLSQSTGVPTDFDVAYVQEVDDDVDVEVAAHRMLSGVRVNERREFFAASVAGASETIQYAALVSLWLRTSAVVRQEFLLRIDTPVFDKGRAA